MATCGYLRPWSMAILAIVVILSSGFNQQVLAAEEVSRSSSPQTSFSLEELMLLADATEKAQKSGADEEDPAKVTNFQHRLRQIVQTARVAAGSGRSTGSDVLDQTIRQVRARINASGGGGSISDTSIFDAAIKAVTRGAGSGGQVPSDTSSLVDTIVNQLNPQVATTPAPADNSFVGGFLRQLANNNNEDGSSGGTGKAIFDAVVKQLVPTTTTTTTTTTPKPQVLQLLDGLVRAYQGSKTPQQVEGRADAGANAPASPSSGVPDPSKLLEGFKSILQQIQNRQGGAGGDASSPSGQGSTGPQLIEGFINQLKQLQNRGAPANSPDSAGAPPSGSMPDLGFLQDMLKQFQSRLNPGGGREGSTGPPVTDPSVGLDGFEGLIPEGGRPTDVGGTASHLPPPTVPPSPPSGNNRNNPSQLIGGFLRQLSNNAQQGGTSGVGDFLKGLGDKFRNSGK